MSETNSGKLYLSNILIFTCALVLAMFVQGAVPFVATPTLGQAVWTTGFSQSFLNESVFSIYAHNIGAPKPAAMAFGLSGAWLTAVFIKIGLLAPDAYSAMISVWMSVAFCSAYSIARHFSVSRSMASLAAFCWLTMPMTWAHASYSMLSTGIGLLPLYFLFSIKIFDQVAKDDTPNNHAQKLWVLLYPGICVISIFMDGYSFMMFAIGASILGVWMYKSSHGKVKKCIARLSLPTHFAGLGVAYLLFSLYIGKPQFSGAPIDFFRAWGADLTFFLIPTKGMHWIPDLIGWSVQRSEIQFFGDASVWRTSFSIPVVIGAVWAVYNIYRQRKLVVGLVLITVFGFYMSLGPSFKIHSVKPEGSKLGVMMTKEYAVAPTGSAVLSKNIPGFKNMRASYRWGALGVFGAWSLMVFGMSTKNKRKIIILSMILVCTVTILNLPNLSNKFKNDIKYRKMFLAIDSDLNNDLREVLHQGDNVAFVPWRNDFLVNYIASTLDVVSFNIGGDKNYTEARKHWPKTMRSFPMARVDDDFSDRVLIMLARRETDVVVFPYIDMLWAAHHWPYPIQFKEELEPKLVQLADSGFVDITERNFYAAARLKPQFTHVNSDELEILIGEGVCMPPYCLKRNKFNASTPSKVGIVQGGKLVSTGHAGFVHFGPYIQMMPNSYRLTIQGSGIVSTSAWVDVVSGKGTIQIAKFPMKSIEKKSGILAEGLVELDFPAQDIEVRIYIGAEDNVKIEGYELVAIDPQSVHHYHRSSPPYQPRP